MKKKIITKKLMLNKSSISILTNKSRSFIKGGTGPQTTNCTDRSRCCPVTDTTKTTFQGNTITCDDVCLTDPQTANCTNANICI